MLEYEHMGIITDLKLIGLGFNPAEYGKIIALIDFGNVSKWSNQIHWGIDIARLGELLDTFCEEQHFFYGHRKGVITSEQFIMKARTNGFVTHTKEVKKIRHRPDVNELRKMSQTQRAFIKKDQFGYFLTVEKCDFDVEITLTALRRINDYDTIILWSGDGDFNALVRYLRKKDKKVIVVSPWEFFSKELQKNHDVHINPDRLKMLIGYNKKPATLASRRQKI
ncbi:NYN domain-containing protein [Patescibacteria group bacterium]|nr:NYN domain-containing protein [Patescibacteria group bacterium]